MISQYPIIVIEGPDGVGKTTLAKALQDYLGAHYLHLTYRFKDRMFDYHTAALWQCLRKSVERPVILDRWWASEIAYANAYRGGTKYPYAGRLFEKAALKHSIIYVFCLPEDKEGYLAHYNELKGRREEMYDEGMERVYDQFLGIYRNLSPRPGVLRYDYTQYSQGSPEFNEFVQHVVETAMDFRVGQWYSANDITLTNVTGHVGYADVVMLGEALKPKTRRRMWPFFDHSHSSLYLARLLDETNIPEWRLMFMNVEDDAGEIGTILHVYPRLKIITMGGKAAKLTRQFPHLKSRVVSELHHPQYYRRFMPSLGPVDLKKAFKQLKETY